MTGIQSSWQMPSVDSPSVLMTWHGTFLMNDPRTDWIMHRKPGDMTGDDNLLVVARDDVPSGWSSPLMRMRTRPLAMPSFMITPGQDGTCTLRCMSSDSSQAMLNHYLCAIPDGTVEINRPAVSAWEGFLLLNQGQYDWLTRVIGQGRIAGPDGQPQPIVLDQGLALISGQYRIDLPANLPTAIDGEPDRLETTTGTVVPIILV